MNKTEFEQTNVSYAIVFCTTLDELAILKRHIAVILEQLPDTRPIYQKAAPGKLRIEVEGG
jgi:hypothetical protein